MECEVSQTREQYYCHIEPFPKEMTETKRGKVGQTKTKEEKLSFCPVPAVTHDKEYVPCSYLAGYTASAGSQMYENNIPK